MKTIHFDLADVYVPTDKQALYHSSPAKYKCFMGGVGSGKTTALDMEALILSLEYPGNYGLIGRYTYPELRDTTMYEFFLLIDKIDERMREIHGDGTPSLIKNYIKTENKLVLINDSVILFRHLEEPDKVKSLNLGWFGIDEMTEVPEDVFLMLQSRLRKKEVPRRVGFGSTNPEGHDWVYTKWCKTHRNDPNYLFVRVSTYDNPHLPDDYARDLEASFPEAWKKRYIDGDPSAFEGQIITAFDEGIHVLEPFDIPAEWTRCVGLDHGTNNPTAVLWTARHPEGPLVVYDEHYEAGQIIKYHAERIIKKTGNQDIDVWLADPAIFNKTLQDPKRGLYSVADEYAEHGLHFSQGDNDVKAGINRLVTAFQINPHMINPFTGKVGSPRVFIMKNCENTIQEIPQYRWAKHRVRGLMRNKPETPEKANDHTVDVLRYQLMHDLQNRRNKVSRLDIPFDSRESRVLKSLERRSKLHARQHPQRAWSNDVWKIQGSEG